MKKEVQEKDLMTKNDYHKISKLIKVIDPKNQVFHKSKDILEEIKK